VNAVDSWKEDLGTLLNCDASNVPIAQFNEVLKKSERWIGSLDNLIESLTSQVLTLRSAEEQWSGIIRGPVGTSEDLLESKDIEELIDRSIS
jgi:hypothetical protein